MELLNGILETFFHEALDHSYEIENCICYVDIKRSIKIKGYSQNQEIQTRFIKVINIYIISY